MTVAHPRHRGPTAANGVDAAELPVEVAAASRRIVYLATAHHALGRYRRWAAHRRLVTAYLRLRAAAAHAQDGPGALAMRHLGRRHGHKGRG